MAEPLKIAYVVLTPREVRAFLYQEDREYFSRPVRVETIDATNKDFVIVRDPARGGNPYPASRKNLKSPLALTRKQRVAAGIESATV